MAKQLSQKNGLGKRHQHFKSKLNVANAENFRGTMVKRLAMRGGGIVKFKNSKEIADTVRRYLVQFVDKLVMCAVANLETTRRRDKTKGRTKRTTINIRDIVQASKGLDGVPNVYASAFVIQCNSAKRRRAKEIEAGDEKAPAQ